MSARRRVRATPAFFDILDTLLHDERGPRGEPSRADFEAIDLLRAIEVFATRFDGLPPLIPGRGDYRMLLASGFTVAAYAITGQLAQDGAVELVDVDLDMWPPEPLDG